MKLTVAGAFAGFVFLAARSPALAQIGPAPRPPQPPGNSQPNPRPAALGPMWNDPQLAERLGINADQKKKLEAAVQEHRLKRVDLNAAMQKAQLLLEPLVNAEQPDENRILAQIERVTQAQGEIQKDEMRLQLALRRVLTPEQWSRMEQERLQPVRPAEPPAGGPRPGPRPQGAPPTN